MTVGDRVTIHDPGTCLDGLQGTVAWAWTLLAGVVLDGHEAEGPYAFWIEGELVEQAAEVGR